jgi:hypothetical protein
MTVRTRGERDVSEADRWLIVESQRPITPAAVAAVGD